MDLSVTRGLALFVVRLMGLLLVTAAGTFTLLSFSPVDPIRAYIGNDLLHVPPEQYPLIAARWGLDLPLWVYHRCWPGGLHACAFAFGLWGRRKVSSYLKQR